MSNESKVLFSRLQKRGFRTTFVLVVLGIVVSSGAFGSLSDRVHAQAAKFRVAVSIPDMKLTFFINMAKQIQDEAAKQTDIQIDLFDGRGQTANQAADMDKIISEKYDGLLISPINAESMITAIQAVVDANIPVVTIDRYVNGVQTLGHVGGDNVKGGQAQAEFILKLFPKGAKIFNIQGTPGASPAVDRNEGFHKILDGKSDYKIVFEKTANFNRPDARALIEANLKMDDLPDVISCANDDMALGVLDVLRSKGLNGKIAVLGYDALPEALLAVKNSDMAATIEQFPGGQSREALNVLLKFLRDKKTPDIHDNYLTPSVITKDNLADAERIKELDAPATAVSTMAGTVVATEAATLAATAAK